MKYESLQSQELVAAFLVGIETRSSPLPIADCQFPIDRQIATRCMLNFENQMRIGNRHLAIENVLCFYGAGNQRFAHTFLGAVAIGRRLPAN